MQYGFWLKNDGTIADVTNTTHMMFITSHPDLFGLTSEGIKDVCDRFGERFTAMEFLAKSKENGPRIRSSKTGRK